MYNRVPAVESTLDLQEKIASAAFIAPALAPALDQENPAEAAIAGGGLAALASTVGAPYTWGPEYEMARTEAQLKKYKDALADPSAKFLDKLKLRLKYYNPLEAIKDYRAKKKLMGTAFSGGKATGKALLKSYLRSGALGLGAAALAAGYTRYGPS